MTADNQILDTSLRIVREFRAPVETVYKSWTDPSLMVKWMGPGEVGCKDVQIDLKVGGRYKIHMFSQEGDHIAVGEYKEIIENQKLQFTWKWKDGEMPDTLVTVSFEDHNGNTKLTLVHENFPVKEASEKHNEGWEGCFAGLEQFLAG